jgi:hypothetical protein
MERRIDIHGYCEKATLRILEVSGVQSH